MSDHVGDSSDEGQKTTPGESWSDHPVPEAEESAGTDATGVYGTAGRGADDGQAPGEPVPGDQWSGSEGPATAVYGTTGAASPQWSTPGASPQQTAVQPIPAQPAPAPVAYNAPQPAPTMQAQQVAAGYAPAAAPAPTGGRHWNMWAGIPAAAAVYALGGLWRLIRIGTTAFDFPVREQLAIGVMAAGVVVGVLTLAALATRKRGLAAPLAFLLGGVLMIDVVYGWYLQMDRTFAGFDANFLFETLIPLTLPPLLLAAATLGAALVMRVDIGRR